MGTTENEDEEALRRLVEMYEHEIDSELERKRSVFRSHIVKATIEDIKKGSQNLESGKSGKPLNRDSKKEHHHENYPSEPR